MSEIANARINTFGKSPKADFVSPSRDQLITLTIGQLQDLITQAVEKAIQPLQDRVESLEATITSLDTKVSTLESTQETQADNQLIQLRLINELRETSKKGPGKTEVFRAEKIEKYLASRPDHRATFETLKGYLQVNNVRLNDAIKILMVTSDRLYSIQKPITGDKRKRILVMLPR
jgi:TolA-binding protein